MVRRVSDEGWEDRVRAAVAAITDGTAARSDELRGLSEDMIREVELDQPAGLPEAYRLFLALVGGGAGQFFQGSHVYYPSILGLWESARELLAENKSPFVLEDSDRVILMHQGYYFDFLRGPGPDPDVWSYGEGTSWGNVPARSDGSFTDWLLAAARSQVRDWAALDARQKTSEVRRDEP